MRDEQTKTTKASETMSISARERASDAPREAIKRVLRVFFEAIEYVPSWVLPASAIRRHREMREAEKEAERIHFETNPLTAPAHWDKTVPGDFCFDPYDPDNNDDGPFDAYDEDGNGYYQ